MRKKQKRLSLLLFVILLCVNTIILPSNVQAAGTYNVSAALSYAQSHWNDGKGLCAEFVSDCLKAGGCSAYSASATALLTQLKSSGMGTLYEINLSSGQTINMNNYQGKISAGDPVFYYCPSCVSYDGKPYIHTVLCNGSDSSGYMKAYSHNGANSGTSRYGYSSYCYVHETTPITTAYVYHFGESDQLPISAVDVIEAGEGTVHIRGWAYDPDVPSQQLEIHVYVGGDSSSSNAVGYRITADKERQDVNNVYGCGNYHGFDETITVGKRGSQEVYVYAINANSSNHPIIGSSTVTIKYRPSTVKVSSDLSVKIGETKTFDFTYENESGIPQLMLELSNSNCTWEWGEFDTSAPKGQVKLTGITAGTTTLIFKFMDSNGKDMYRIPFTVNIIDSHTHSYTTKKVSQSATCTTTGYGYYYCSCGERGNKYTISQTGHSGGTSTCSSLATCSKCGKEYGYLGYHKYSTEWTIDKAATCTTAGSKSHHCIYCEKQTDVTTIAATGHSGGTATCTTKAKCSKCGTLYGSVRSHSYSTSWTIDKVATCTAAGSKSHHCTGCSAKKDVTAILATGHSGGTATCAAQAKCSACNTYYGNLKEHTYENGVCTMCGRRAQSTNQGDESGTVDGSNNGTVDGTDDDNHAANNISGQNVNENTNSSSNTENRHDQYSNDISDQNNDSVPRLGLGEMFTVNGFSYMITDIGMADNYVAITGIENKNATLISVPSTVAYKGMIFKVTEVRSYAFVNMKKLKKVVIGSNVTTIGKKAFWRCKKLESITIKSKKLKEVGSAAFKNISKKTVLKVPKSKMKKYKKLLKKKGIFYRIK